MLNEIQVIPGQNNCVIVSTGYPQHQQQQQPIQPGQLQKPIPIAPAPNKYNNNNQQQQQQPAQTDLLRCKKKVTYKQASYANYQSASIIRRNARERNRVKQVNDGFAALRKHLPPDVVATLSNNTRRSASKKLSKVDTLRMVVEYIRYLQQLLEEDGDKSQENQENHHHHHRYYAAEVNQRIDHGYLLDQTPPSSETSSSPAPSFSSDVSSGAAPVYTIPSCYPMDKYESQAINPMDEELLDVISWWQQK